MAAQVDLALANLINERTNAAQAARDIMSRLGESAEVKLPKGLDIETVSDILPGALFNDNVFGDGTGCIVSVCGVERKKVSDVLVTVATETKDEVEVPIDSISNPEIVLRFIEMFL